MTSNGALPTAPTCRADGIGEIQIKTGPYCGIATQIGANNNTINATLAMQGCCLGAPIISLSNSCDIYCNAVNQTTDQLMDCLLQLYGGSKGNTAGVLCQKDGSSIGSITAKPMGITKSIVLATLLWAITKAG
jgi:hypothetical protein